MPQLRDVMTTDVQMVPADAPVQEAAAKMKDLDVGVLPVWDGKEVVGVLTDRDITVRATAEGDDPKDAKVADVMTKQVLYVYEDDDVEKATKVMKERQIRRLAVFNRDNQLVGMVSLGDVATDGSAAQAAEALESVSEGPGNN